MFDTSFFEIIVILVVALLVIGPERLPAVAKTLGQWIGKFKAMGNKVKADFEQQLKIDELEKNKKRAAAADEKIREKS